MDFITITGARQGTLKNLTLTLPKGRLIALTGVSGSGKSTLAIDVLFTECQRLYLEALGMQGIAKPDVDRIRGATPAICIAQNRYAKNPRSSLGTISGIYTDLRMVYEKLAARDCPHCGARIKASDCVETTKKVGSDFFVYMDCVRCGQRMDKLTRTHFSFNTREGACPDCEGMGTIYAVNKRAVLDDTKSLEDGAIDCWAHRYGAYQIDLLAKAFAHYGMTYVPGTPVADFPPAGRALLLHGIDAAPFRAFFPDVAPPRQPSAGRFEGAYPWLMRKLGEKGGATGALSRYFGAVPCPACHGERLQKVSRSATVMDTRIGELGKRSLEAIGDWLEQLDGQLTEPERTLVDAYLLDLRTKIKRLRAVGLAYLTLDRQAQSLSGGEAQRLRLAATLDSDLSGILYILDEPTTGLHPSDTEGMLDILRHLRDLGNTVLVLEHDALVMRAADHVVDMGPGAGRFGGEIVAEGTFQQILSSSTSVTGAYLRAPNDAASRRRAGDGGFITIKDAHKNNLRHVHLRIPTGTLTCVTGVSGSGKSTLVFEELGALGPNIEGLDAFHHVLTIDQMAPARMKRSNVATYVDLYAHIRALFAAQPDAAARGLTARDFSFNAKGGRCESCEGLGTIRSNMLFFLDIDVTCPACGGKRFHDQVLSVMYRGLTIDDVLSLSVHDAMSVFADHAGIMKALSLLHKVGLSYLQLGQTLTTLSGGEAQRLKLSKALLKGRGEKTLYLIDEPTTGLHPLDTQHFLALLHEMVDAGHTVVVVEHNPQLIGACDHIIDLGPGGGVHGGDVVATGTPDDIRKSARSLTGRYL